MKKNVVLSTKREIPLLLFLWKWKLSTTAGLIQKFFPDCNGKTAYNRILALRHAGLICVRADSLGQKFVCALDKDGFHAIRERLPELKEEGYKSEHLGHDLLVSAFHLGNWLTRKPNEAALFSEQELRRLDPEFYPDWVPQSDLHRPDGYSLVPGKDGHETFAIEVELHRKKEHDYTRVAEFYAHFHGIRKILWLVPQQSFAFYVEKKMIDPLAGEPSRHNFVLIEEFQNYGWGSRIFIGPDQGKQLTDLLLEVPPKSGRIPAESNLAKALLDTRKSPHLTNAYEGFQFGDSFD